ncbi:hypothetical protein [Streptomyces sp. NPDC001315]|uniref:hypothetical protein n=1 Tax=Streptomyces sp. NPDC001315 TaxID=3364562 RepID=UPI00368A3F9F
MNPSAVSPTATVGLCEGAGCRRDQGGGRSRTPSIDGLRLCTGCLSRLVAGLRALDELYTACEQALGGAPAQPREKTSGGPLPGMPFNADAAEARKAILATLGSWSGLVAAERRVPAPRRVVRVLADFLVLHAPWLAGHPAVAELTEEIARSAARARRVAHPDLNRKVRIGACVEAGCDGELVASLRAAEPTELATIQCGVHPEHTWAGHQWTQLRRTLREEAAPAGASRAAEGRWLTAAEVARLWTTSLGTVYRLASEQRWNRRTRAGRTYYSEADVHACFSRRAARG